MEKFYLENNIENLIFDYDKGFVDKIINCDLCITRAGASTLAELSVLNIPFIAVPLPNSKDNHQFENANFYKKENCCWIIEENLIGEKIEQLIKDIFQKKTDLLEKKQNLKRLNYQNTWINVNQKIIKTIDEN